MQHSAGSVAGNVWGRNVSISTPSHLRTITMRNMDLSRKSFYIFLEVIIRGCQSLPSTLRLEYSGLKPKDIPNPS